MRTVSAALAASLALVPDSTASIDLKTVLGRVARRRRSVMALDGE